MWQLSDDNDVTVDRLNALLHELQEVTTEAAELHEAVNHTIAESYVDHTIDGTALPHPPPDGLRKESGE